MKLSPLSHYTGRIQKLFVLDYMNQMVDFKSITERYAGILDAFQHPIELTILANTRLDGISKLKGKNAFPFKDKVFNVGMHQVTFQSPLSYTTFMEPGLRKLLGARMPVMTDGNFFSSVPWAQDPFSVLTTAQGDTVLLDPWYNDLYFDYQLVGRALAGQTDAVLKPTPLYLSGGNILQAEDYIMVGMDVVRKNQKLTGLSENEVLTELKKAFGVEDVIMEGSKIPWQRKLNCFQGFFQPLFHLDMFVTLGGRMRDGEKEKELIFVGELEVVGELENAELSAHLQRVGESMDEMAKRLAKTTFAGRKSEVRRIPLPILLSERGEQGSWQYLSMNNALVEITEEEKRIYLPQYQMSDIDMSELDALRRKARNVYQSCGFAVTSVEGPYSDFSRAGGALHCIAKVLQRKS